MAHQSGRGPEGEGAEHPKGSVGKPVAARVKADHRHIGDLATVEGESKPRRESRIDLDSNDPLHPLGKRKGAATEASANLDDEVVAPERGCRNETFCDLRL